MRPFDLSFVGFVPRIFRNSCSQYAVDIITALLEENDENIQLWSGFSTNLSHSHRYLAGVAELGPENHPEVADLDASGYYLTHAKEMIEHIQKNNQVRT